MSRYEKDPANLNIIRKFQGLAPVVQKKRKCLRCNIRFVSTGAHNRLCDSCREALKGETDG